MSKTLQKHPDSKRNDDMRKMNTLRSNYRRENFFRYPDILNSELHDYEQIIFSSCLTKKRSTISNHLLYLDSLIRKQFGKSSTSVLNIFTTFIWWYKCSRFRNHFFTQDVRFTLRLIPQAKIIATHVFYENMLIF